VHKNKIIIGLFSLLMLFSFISTSEASLWELVLIDVNVQNNSINPGESVVVTGKIVDQAYKPIRGAEISIRAGSDTAKAFTDPWGIFRAEIKDFQGIPGTTYTVNVIGSWYEMTGFSNTQFHVKGEASPVSGLQGKLSTDEAIKYLSSKEVDFENDPIGQTLFKYYHGLLEELISEQREAGKASVNQDTLEEQREIAKNLRDQKITEYNPRIGIYDGYQYETYINSLNPEIKDVVVSQLEFTKNTIKEAKKIKEEIIVNGGTYHEAMQAYLKMISMPKETLEQFNQDQIDKNSKNSSEDNQTSNQDSVNQ
jgi:hypothetical protein